MVLLRSSLTLVSCIALVACAPKIDKPRNPMALQIEVPSTYAAASAEQEKAYEIAYKLAKALYPSLQTQSPYMADAMRTGMLAGYNKPSNDLTTTCAQKIGQSEFIVDSIMAATQPESIYKKVAENWSMKMTAQQLQSQYDYITSPAFQKMYSENIKNPNADIVSAMNNLRQVGTLSDAEVQYLKTFTNSPDAVAFERQSAPERTALRSHKYETSVNNEALMQQFYQAHALEVQKCLAESVAK